MGGLFSEFDIRYQVAHKYLSMKNGIRYLAKEKALHGYE